MTLWPISMFSTILATPRVAVPAHHAERRELAGEQQSAGYLQRTLRCNGPTDVARVSRAARVFGVLADRVELHGQVFDIGIRQMREYVDVCDRHRLDPPVLVVRSVTYAIVTYESVGYL